MPRLLKKRDKFGLKSPAGFSIVEVLIVLAVAGMIMGVVLAAVPALQRNSRDNTRKNIASRIRSEIENYAGNRVSTYPFKNVPGTVGTDTDWANFYSVVLSKIDINDPSRLVPVIDGNPFATPKDDASYVAAYDSATVKYPKSKGLLAIVTGASCSGASLVQNAGANSYAIVIGLDKAGARYCSDNR